MCLGDLHEKSQFVLPWPLCLAAQGKDWAFPPLPSLARWGVCLHHLTGLPGYSTTCPVQVRSALERGVLPPTADTPYEPHTSSSDHLGCWYNTTNPNEIWWYCTWRTILSKTGDGQGLHGKPGCWDETPWSIPLTSGLTLPNNCYLCEGGRSTATWCRADMLPCLPDTSHSLQGPSLLSIAPLLPQQGATLPFSLWRGGKGC